MEIKLTGNKGLGLRNLIYSILDVFNEIGIPMDTTPRRLERMALACMAVGNIKQNLREAKSSDDEAFLTTREIIAFENKYFNENISPGSYDDIRRKDLMPLVTVGIVLNSASLEAKSTNNPTRGYALNPNFVKLLKDYGSTEWSTSLHEYRILTKHLTEKLQHNLDINKIPVKISDKEIILSYGEHNLLQKQIVEEFLPRFGMGAEVLYIGDTSKKILVKESKILNEIGFFSLEHEELPDIVAYNRDKNLLFLIEAVHSSGPMDEIRVIKLKNQLVNCIAKPIFITTFLNMKEFKKWVDKIAWESEVWISDNPDHMIHFNGYKFLEIHK